MHVLPEDQGNLQKTIRNMAMQKGGTDWRSLDYRNCRGKKDWLSCRFQ